MLDKLYDNLIKLISSIFLVILIVLIVVSFLKDYKKYNDNKMEYVYDVKVVVLHKHDLFNSTTPRYTIQVTAKTRSDYYVQFTDNISNDDYKYLGLTDNFTKLDSMLVKSSFVNN